jgi:hypothetical protein
MGAYESTTSRWGAGTGIVFVALFIVGWALALGTPDSSEAPAAEWAAWFADSSHRAPIIAGMFLVVLSCFAFMWFAGSVLVGVRATAAAERLWWMASAAALLFGSVVLVGGAVLGTVAGSVSFGDVVVPAGGVIRTIEAMFVVLILVSGGISSALFVVLVSALGRKADAFPSWLEILGYLLGAAMALGITLAPGIFEKMLALLAFLVWVLIVSIHTMARRTGT